MRCAFAFTAAALVVSARLTAMSGASVAPRVPPPTMPRPVQWSDSSADRRLLILKMPVFSETAVRRAVDIAVRKLTNAECRDVYGDFLLPDGQTPRRQLDSIGLEPAAFIETLVFVDGSLDPVCQAGVAGLTTSPGSRLIRVCPRFAEFQLRDPRMSGVLIIHESLHALGVGENPPSSSEITHRVERRCWKTPDLRGSLPPRRARSGDVAMHLRSSQ